MEAPQARPGPPLPKGIAHATAGGPFAVMESSEAGLALIARTEVADRRNATCHDGRA
jgi:hypothetical protein